MKEKQKARIVQESLNCGYQTALRLVRGEISYKPVSSDCLMALAFTVLNVTAGPVKGDCRCDECAKAKKP